MPRQTLGVCYYPEHWDKGRWPVDARMMREAGILRVRIGEFAWSRLEPDPGHYDFGWMADAIDTFAAEGLEVVLGTPTAAPPKWLVDRMPDMVAVTADGRPRRFGSRRHYCFSHEPYARECDRILTALAEAFGRHPAVVAWQTDNEFGCHDTVESYSAAALAAFRRWCAGKYNTPEALNRAWGNVFWSMEVRSFDEVELPNLTVTEANPSHRLDFQRFSSDQVVRFNRRQCDIIRAHSPGRAILHNFMGSFTAFDHYAVGADLDAATWDSYPLGLLDRDTDDPVARERYMRVGDPDLQAFHHDLYRACGRGRWWVMEQQPGPVNWAPWNPAPAPGAVRMWTWEAFAAGAETVCYFRWRQAPFAQEQMHEALLLPNHEPNEGYGVVQAVSRELDALGATVESRRSSVALVFDYESQWAWSIQPHGRDFSYLKLVLTFYRALRRLGVSVDVVPPTAEAVADRRLVLLPGLFAPREDFADALAASGAVVFMGPRTGSKTPDFQIPLDLPPGPLRRLVDVKIRRVESLRPSIAIPVTGANVPLALNGWREFIVPGAGVTTELSSTDGEPVLLSQGNAVYLGGRPDEALADVVVLRLLDRAGLEAVPLPRDIRLRDNGDLRFAINYGPEPLAIDDIAGGAPLLLGERVLPSCGVAAWRPRS